MKSLHIITGLTIGGAEMMLFKVVSGLKFKGNPRVISLSDGPIGQKITQAGIELDVLNFQKSKIPTLSTIKTLFGKFSSSTPDLIQGWMYHGNLAALLAGFVSKKPVVWNIRQTLYDLNNEKPLTKWIIRLNAILSCRSDAIIYNSETSARQHEHFGFNPSKTVIIPNGFDTEIFAPSIFNRDKIRNELGIAKDGVVIGLVGRFHPMKDHLGFLKAAELLAKDFNNVEFILVGNGIDLDNKLMVDFKNILGTRIHLLGARNDISEITSAFDIAVSASAWGEAFPNTIGEAMSSEIPCIVTDIGDSARIVGSSGLVVPAKSPEALYQGMKKFVLLSPVERAELGQKARARVIKNYSLASVVDAYSNLYMKLSRKG